MNQPRSEIEDLFRREAVHLVAALARLLGPARLALAEDAVHDALTSAMQSWRFGVPDDPKAWILQVAKNRAIDLLRRERRHSVLADAQRDDEEAVELVLSPEADGENQLAMMLAVSDDALSPETHVTLILRFLCGFSPGEIARAFLLDVGTIDRRLHRGRARLRELGQLVPPEDENAVRARQPSIEQALYLVFNEGYHASDADNPLRPAMCADALRLAELLLHARGIEPSRLHALAALFCFNGARLGSRVREAEIVPLAAQDRAEWDPSLIARGIAHLGASAEGETWTRWHLEAGIAFEHTRAPSLEATDWAKIVAYYDALALMAPGPIVALNRGLAVAELRGLDAGRVALVALESDPKLAEYSFYWAARADIERRAGNIESAKAHYARASNFAKNAAERASYERRIRTLAS